MREAVPHAIPNPDVSFIANRSLSVKSSFVGYSGRSKVLKLKFYKHNARLDLDASERSVYLPGVGAGQ